MPRPTNLFRYFNSSPEVIRLVVMMSIALPHIARDLQAGGRRLDQKAIGCDATIASGGIIAGFDEATGARPGRLVRGVTH